MKKVSIYDSGEVYRRYDRARGLPEETTRLWLEKLSPHAPHGPEAIIIDVGCGTGRFTVALAERFAATVYGVDPSVRMLSVAAESVARSRVASRVHFVQGEAERIPLRDRLGDLAFLSMVYHHIADKDGACREFRRVLRDDARLAVRTATRERVDGFLWHRFFPAAREIDLRRLPSAQELRAHFENHDFRPLAHESVRQLFARDLKEYCERIAMRALSSLQSIPDEAFADGLAELRRHCAARDAAEAVYEEIDLFVFAVE